MTLEGFDHDTGPRIENTADLNAVAVARQHGLQRFHGFAAIARRQESTAADWTCVNEMPDTGGGERFPRKPFAGIDLATRCHIRMRKHIVRPDTVPPGDTAAEPNHGLNLDGGKIPVA